MPVPAPPDDGLRRRAHALADPTRVELLRLVERRAGADGCTIADLTGEVRLHHSVVRDHLRSLEEAGLVTGSVVSTPGARGRPPTRYRSTDAASDLLAGGGRVTEVARLLATVASTGSSPDDVGRAHADGVALVPARRGEGPVDRFVTDLARRGFQPTVRGTVGRSDRPSGPEPSSEGAHWEGGAAHIDVVLHRCPLTEVAVASPAVVCALHRGFAEGLAARLGGFEVEGLTVHAPRVAGCVFHLAVGP